MLKFITRFFAFIGFVVVALIAIGILVAIYGQPKAEVEPDSVVLTIDFSKPISEQIDPSPFDLAMNDEPTTLLDILHAIDAAKADPHVKAIAARFGTEQPSLAQTQEIRAAMKRFHASGKPTYAFGTDFGEFGLGNRAYYLASAFDNIWLQPVGTVSLTGISLQSPFGKTALDKLGITADFMQREEYKSFMEMGQRDNFSPLVKAEMQTMVEDLADQLASGIAESRQWDVAHVKDLMNGGPYTDEEALQEKLVTRLAYSDDLDEELEQKFGKDVKQVEAGDYLDYSTTKKDADKTTPTKVAIIFAQGLIVEKSIGGADVMGEHALSADEVAEAFGDAVEDKDVKAILFRIDSPGGSPAASETIRHAMIAAQKKGKPVIVSMADTAASGGYWIAMNGDKIVADPGTLTGSIGVVAGKFEGEELMKKLGVSMDGASTSENAGMWNISEPFTPAQRARVNALLDNTYHSFVSNVSAARKIPMEKMPDIAKGRVWTGNQAIKIGLVDALGGYDVALGEIRKSLKLDENAEINLETFPAQPSPAERLLKFLKHFNTESVELSMSLAALAKTEAVFVTWFGGLAGVDQHLSATMPYIRNNQ